MKPPYVPMFRSKFILKPTGLTDAHKTIYIMKKGDKIRIIRMDDNNGKDHQAAMMNGMVVTVKFIDGIGQIHLEESGLALIPGTDEFEVL